MVAEVNQRNQAAGLYFAARKLEVQKASYESLAKIWEKKSDDEFRRLFASASEARLNTIFYSELTHTLDLQVLKMKKQAKRLAKKELRQQKRSSHGRN